MAEKKNKINYGNLLKRFYRLLLSPEFITTFVVQAYKIPSRSMVPTLLVGDHLLVNKFIYGVKIPLPEKNHYSRYQSETRRYYRF